MYRGNDSTYIWSGGAQRSGGAGNVGKAILDTGEELDCDLLIDCKGITFSQIEMSPEFGECKSEDGRIKTTENLSIASHPNVFAMGESIWVPPGKTRTWSGAIDFKKQVDTITANICCMIEGKTPTATFTHQTKEATQIGMITMGEGHQVSQLFCCCECCDDGLGSMLKNNKAGPYFTHMALADFGKGKTW